MGQADFPFTPLPGLAAQPGGERRRLVSAPCAYNEASL
jgi:hypothetical protein